MPILGPDLIDPRQLPQIKEGAWKKLAGRRTRLKTVDEEAKPRPKRVVKPPKVPTWDVTPTEEAAALAGSINQALQVDGAGNARSRRTGCGPGASGRFCPLCAG